MVFKSAILVSFCCILSLGCASLLGERSNHALLAQLRHDPYGFGLDKPGRVLASRGAQAAPEIPKEFEQAQDYYLLCLVNILCKIPSPERDQAFLRKLEEKKTAKDDFLLDDYASPMMMALAKSHCQEALPILSEYAKAPDMDREAKTQALIALTLLGVIQEENAVSCRYVISEDLKPLLNLPWTEQALTWLDAIIAYKITADPGELMLSSIQEKEGRVEGRFTNRKGTWGVTFLKGDGNRVGFIYDWYTGPLAAAGYCGCLEKRQTGWVVTSFRCRWRS